MRDEPKMDAKRLITEVHKRPALWNQRHISYHNREVTNRIWMEIATLFKLPKQVLKTKWKGLRDTFRAEIKKDQVYRKSKYTPNRPAWIHFKTLQFLKEQMLPRPPIWERNANSRDDASSAAASEDSSCAGTDASETIGDVAALLNPKTRREIPITAAGAPAASASATATFVASPRTKEQRRASSRIGAATNLHLKLVTRRNSPSVQKSLLRKSCPVDAMSVVSVKEDLAAATNATQHRPNILSFKSSSNNNTNNNVGSYNGTDNAASNNSNNNVSSNSNSSKNQIVISCPVKLEPHDNYEENVDEFGNIAEEMSNLVDEGSMLGSMSTEEVLMAAESAAAENCSIAAGQHAVDPLEGNRFDDNYYFFMSLLPHIRSLPAERRMLLRMQMQQLVYQEVYDKSRSTPHQDQRSRSPC